MNLFSVQRPMTRSRRCAAFSRPICGGDQASTSCVPEDEPRKQNSNSGAQGAGDPARRLCADRSARWGAGGRRGCRADHHRWGGRRGPESRRGSRSPWTRSWHRRGAHTRSCRVAGAIDRPASARDGSFARMARSRTANQALPPHPQAALARRLPVAGDDTQPRPFSDRRSPRAGNRREGEDRMGRTDRHSRSPPPSQLTPRRVAARETHPASRLSSR
jgi:hypothetical protein